MSGISQFILFASLLFSYVYAVQHFHGIKEFENACASKDNEKITEILNGRQRPCFFAALLSITITKCDIQVFQQVNEKYNQYQAEIKKDCPLNYALDWTRYLISKNLLPHSLSGSVYSGVNQVGSLVSQLNNLKSGSGEPRPVSFFKVDPKKIEPATTPGDYDLLREASRTCENSKFRYTFYVPQYRKHLSVDIYCYDDMKLIAKWFEAAGLAIQASIDTLNNLEKYKTNSAEYKFLFDEKDIKHVQYVVDQIARTNSFSIVIVEKEAKWWNWFISTAQTHQGVFAHPVIYIPFEDFKALPRQMMTHMLVHELSHGRAGTEDVVIGPGFLSTCYTYYGCVSGRFGEMEGLYSSDRMSNNADSIAYYVMANYYPMFGWKERIQRIARDKATFRQYF